MKKTITFISRRAAMLLLVMLLTTITAGAQDAIDGLTYNDAGGYYEINDAQDLIDLAEYIRGGTGRYCEGATFKMTADLDFTDMPLNCHDKKNYGTGNFVPIAIDAGDIFRGHFDGDGHTITGLRFSYTSNNIGLFRYMDNASASVENLTLVNPNFSALNSVGGIVGYLQAGTVSNCTVVGGTVSGSGEKVGGIVGLCIYNTSTDVKTITGCTVIGTTVSGSSYVGAIVGTNTGTTSANNALTISNCTYDATTNENIVGYGYGTMFTDGGGNKMVYQVNLGENVTASGATYSSALLPGKAYYASGATVTLGHTDRTGYDFSNYSVNGTAIDGSTFTMPASNVTVSTTWTPDPVHFADNGDGTYTIKTATGWDVFCDALQDNDTWNGFSGKTVVLDKDITVTRMAGSDGHDFCGTFDGQGYTLTVDFNSADITDGSTQYVAPFRYVSNVNSVAATIRNLHVTGNIDTDMQYTAGLIGGCWGNVSIENCAVSTAINSTISGAGGHGGIVGIHSSGTLTITGCVFDGRLLGTTTHSVGGFIGWRNSSARIYNSLFAPEAVTVSNTSGATFARNTVDTYNCYYTTLLNDGTNYVPALADGTVSPAKWYNGKALHTVTAGTDVTISAIALTGDATQYTVSGITAYSGGGLQLGENLYYGSGDAVSLTLSNTGAPAGYQYDGYTVSAGTLSGSTLTMPAEDVTISNALAPIDWATESTGADWDNAYMIYNKDQLDLLAQRVNSGTTYENKYFKLGADITYSHTTDWNDATSTENNYTAIGGYHNEKYGYFYGHFDGQGYTVSGIRIYKDGNTDYDSAQGLFGDCKSSATIENVILADARITGYACVGGIVGSNDGTVSNCHVLSNVTIHAVHNSSAHHGGIVGVNDFAVTACTSAASITVAPNTTSVKRGGIVGWNHTATVSNCLYLGNTLGGTSYVGAIVGNNEAGATVTNSYYTDPDITGKNNSGNAHNHVNSAVGYNQNSGTVTGCGPAMQDNADNSNFLTLMAARNAALTAVDRTTPLSTAVDITLQGRTLYKDGDWNTLCLPFAVSTTSGPLSGDNVEAMVLNGGNSGLSGTTLTLNFDAAPATIPAGTPFIVKWDNTGVNITNPKFTGVTVSNATNNVAFTGGSFKGTYEKMAFAEENKSILFVGANDKLHWPEEGASLGACRAYFELSDVEPGGGGGEAPELRIVLNFGEEEKTGISSLTPDPSPSRATLLPSGGRKGEGSDYYTLDGRKLNGKPTQKGLYIVNGKKVVIK